MVDPILVKFLNQEDVQDFLREENFAEIYEKANSRFSSALYTGLLTPVFYDAGVDPLAHLSRVPRNFAFGIIHMAEITIPVSIKAIQQYAFTGCVGLRHIRYEGTKEQWKRIPIHVGNAAMQRQVTVHCIDGDLIGTRDGEWEDLTA